MKRRDDNLLKDKKVNINKITTPSFDLMLYFAAKYERTSSRK